jgi:DNA segregation ATPase FtsK/SpoIIIE, S-DNA-T family
MPYLNIIKTLISFLLFVFLAAALFSYDASDPSLNQATDISAKNLAGNFGAYLADPIFQLFGLASIIITLIPLFWSFSFLRNRKISLWFLRILSGFIALVSSSLLFSYLDYSNDYFKLTGGIAGKLLNIKLSSYDVPEYGIQLSAAFVAIVSLYFSLSITLSSIENMSKRFYNGILSFIRILRDRTNFFIEKLRNSNKANIASPTLTEKTARPITPEPIREAPPITKPKIVARVQKPETNINGFILPSTELLKDFPINNDLIQQNNTVIKKYTEELSQVLSDFGVSGDIVSANSGPVVTLYELEPAAGTKSSRIIGLSDDISRSMKAVSARIAVIPGRNAIGVELPNKERETVYLKELLESDEYQNKDYELPIILGKDIAGKVIVADLARMPHLLVAGTTGSGKSVAINTMIMSLVYALTPEQCRFIMVDPKMLELSVYDDIPHLLTNVVTEPGKAVVAMKWVVKEMENRYRLMSNLSVRNVHGYNARIKAAIADGEIIQRTVQTGFDPDTGKPKIEKVPLDMKILPYIVVVVDEMADLMLVAGKDIEVSIQRLAQMARAAGIHIIMATQRPSVDVITGVIKANFPTRISFQVTSKIDSRTILGEQGAEQLLGKGDMLYMAGGSKITRIHGPFVADNEVEKVVSYLKSQGKPDYMDDITSDDGSYGSSTPGAPSDNGISDELYQQALQVVQHEGKASTSFIQRCLKIGYNRAANIMDQMEKEGLVSKPNHVGKREILM